MDLVKFINLFYIYLQNTEIIVKQLRIDPNNFPPYVPDAKFRVDVFLKEDLELIFSLFVRGRVESKKRLVIRNR